MPLIVWAYPRGLAIEAKGGRDSFYAVDYAARTASELGADAVKVNFPHPEKRAGVPAAYDAKFTAEQAIDAVVRSANRTLLLVSGGEQQGDEAMLEKARRSMDAGATGLIFGRNVWQRDHGQSLAFAVRLQEILAKYRTSAGRNSDGCLRCRSSRRVRFGSIGGEFAVPRTWVQARTRVCLWTKARRIRDVHT